MTTQDIAHDLWEKAGKPQGRDLEFWLQAERRQLCVLQPGYCQYQEVRPTTGGRHICICHSENPCSNSADNYL